MLVCVSEDESSEDEQEKKPKDKEKKYIWGKGSMLLLSIRYHISRLFLLAAWKVKD